MRLPMAGSCGHLAGTSGNHHPCLRQRCCPVHGAVQVNALALVVTDLQKDMAKSLIGADLAVVTREPAGAFMSRIMNDLNLVREAFVRLATILFVTF